jgi:hypothetical protein
MSKANFPGPLRFKKFLDPLEELLRNASESQNPAPYLFSNGARDLLFRLEALSRIYKSLHNRKLFEALDEDFKEVEDALGEIDSFDAFEKEFLQIKSLPPAFTNYFTEGRINAQEKLNKILSKKKWLTDKAGKLGKIDKLLNDADWLDPEAERIAIGEFLVKQIDKITANYEKGKLHFNDIENGIHEFRRKLRWLSIYAISLDGLIQLKKSASPDEDLNKYLQPEILNSPFNVLPEPPAGIHPLYVQDKFFYALSWVIQKTGELKDEGLRNEAIQDVAEKTGIQVIEVTDLLNLNAKEKERSPEEICSEAESIADGLINKDMVMEKLKRDLYRSLEMEVTK